MSGIVLKSLTYYHAFQLLTGRKNYYYQM